MWVKPTSEMSFLYGNNIPKSGVGRITDDTPQYAGVIVYNMSDVALGKFQSLYISGKIWKDFLTLRFNL